MRPQSPSEPRAVVTDASERVALHVIRALGRAGISVVATEVEERSRQCPGFSSRYAVEKRVLPSAHGACDGWLEALRAAGRDGDVLVPTCLNSLLRIAGNWERLADQFRILIPRTDMLLMANDKWELYRLAKDRGVPVPQSWSPADRDELHAIADNIEYPVIVKFRHDRDLFFKPADRYVRVVDAASLRAVWTKFNDLQPRPIIQQFIKGDAFGFEALYDQDSNVVATFQHRRLIECPPEGGPSAVCESVKVADIEHYGRGLLDTLKWCGVAMVEFRRCLATGTFYLLEINPRFWGSLPLSEAAGVNFPALYYHCARGEDVEPTTYQEGMRLRFMPTYMRSAAMNLNRNGRSLRQVGRQLIYLFDPRVREGLMNFDDIRGSWAYLRKNLWRGLR